MTSWLDREPPADHSLAAAYWCEMDYFLSHTAYGVHPPCRCPKGMGHNDPAWEAFRARTDAERTPSVTTNLEARRAM